MRNRYAAMVALALGLGAQQGIVTFNSNVRLVEVYTTVFDDRGKYINGLGREHFELLDNNWASP